MIAECLHVQAVEPMVVSIHLWLLPGANEGNLSAVHSTHYVKEACDIYESCLDGCRLCLVCEEVHILLKAGQHGIQESGQTAAHQGLGHLQDLRQNPLEGYIDQEPEKEQDHL